MFDVATNRLDMFQQKYPMKQLVNLWTWWERRKWHVFCAFRPSLNAPRVNLAKSGHSSWKNSGTVYLDLLDAARQDVAENLQLRSNLQSYEHGSYSGKGPGKSELSKRSYAEQEKRAHAFSAELVAYMDQDDAVPPQPKTRVAFVDERASHRHDPPRQASANDEKAMYYKKDPQQELCTSPRHSEENEVSLGEA
jgi:hypothetical protein